MSAAIIHLQISKGVTQMGAMNGPGTRARRRMFPFVLILFMLLYAAFLLMAPCCGTAARAALSAAYSPACVPPAQPTPSVTVSPALPTTTP
jgi:hypothetical protein